MRFCDLAADSRCWLCVACFFEAMGRGTHSWEPLKVHGVDFDPLCCQDWSRSIYGVHDMRVRGYSCDSSTVWGR